MRPDFFLCIIASLLLVGCDSSEPGSELIPFEPGNACQETPGHGFYSATEIHGDTTHFSGPAVVEVRGGVSGPWYWSIRLHDEIGWNLHFAVWRTTHPPERYGTNTHLRQRTDMLAASGMDFIYGRDPFNMTRYTAVEWYLRYHEPDNGSYTGEFWVRLEYLSGEEAGTAREPRQLFGCFSTTPGS